MRAEEIIAKKTISRHSLDDEMACRHRLGESDAAAIIMALESGGYVIVAKEPPPYMNSEAKASYRMNIRVGQRDATPSNYTAEQTK